MYVAASATRQSLLHRSPTGSACVCVCACLSVCEIETSTMKRPRPEFGCCVTEGEEIVPERRCTSTRLHDVTFRKSMISTCPAHCHIRPALSLSPASVIGLIYFYIGRIPYMAILQQASTSQVRRRIPHEMKLRYMRFLLTITLPVMWAPVICSLWALNTGMFAC